MKLVSVIVTIATTLAFAFGAVAAGTTPAAGTPTTAPTEAHGEKTMAAPVMAKKKKAVKGAAAATEQKKEEKTH